MKTAGRSPLATFQDWDSFMPAYEGTPERFPPFLYPESTPASLPQKGNSCIGLTYSLVK